MVDVTIQDPALAVPLPVSEKKMAPVSEEKHGDTDLDPLLKSVAKTLTFRSLALAKKWPPKKWPLEKEADAFVRDIAGMCLTTPDSFIIPEGKNVIVVDEPRCTNELKTLSGAWGKTPTGSFSAVHLSRKSRKVVRKSLHEKFGSLGPSDLGLLAKTPHCDCLVFNGKKASEVADYVRAFQTK